MKGDKPANLSASVRARLMNLARARNEDFQYVLTRYGLERLLYRLSRSPHADAFVLKGAMLFQLWTAETHRPTRDVDLLGEGAPNVERFEQIFREVCAEPVEQDGLVFNAASIHGELVKEDDEYQGIRIRGEATLERARIALQVDIGFGDTVTPDPLQIDYPTLLDFPAPRLLAYNRETVVAEKFQAMIALGMANSRMKDFFDIWSLAQHFDFDGESVVRAIERTFIRRETALPAGIPVALSPEFAADATKRTQWQAFLRRSGLAAGGLQLDAIATTLQTFLLPPVESLIARAEFQKRWPPAGPWQPRR